VTQLVLCNLILRLHDFCTSALDSGTILCLCIHIVCKMDNITASIRVDVVSKQGSVLDVINLMNPNRDKSTASKAISALKQFDEELLNRIHKLRIIGKGKPTPVADARTLVEIVWLLPGTAARAFRRKSANTVCRVLGGDMQSAREIEARH
jgi:hypothetical protein